MLHTEYKYDKYERGTSPWTPLIESVTRRLGNLFTPTVALVTKS